MIFYRVNKSADQTRYPRPAKGWFLVANELITEKEAKKENFSDAYINEYMTKVETSKFNTGWFFGCRFVVDETQLKEI